MMCWIKPYKKSLIKKMEIRNQVLIWTVCYKIVYHFYKIKQNNNKKIQS